MAGIFICYRREDTAGWTGRLQADLQRGLARTVVFRDIDTIPPGVKFEEYISDAVGTCDVLIAMIGPYWINASDAQGRRRLEDPKDLIRLEISTCLQRDIRVIPALVGGARLPAPGDLPEDIRELTRRQAYELSESRWTADCRQLIAALRPIVGTSRSLRPLIAAGVLGLLLLVTTALLVARGRSATTTDGSTAAVATESTSRALSPEAAAEAPELPLQRTRPPGVAAAGGPHVDYVAPGGQGAGVFEFKWPGGDCWEIHRGKDNIASRCGTAKQALQAGRYTVKALQGAVFQPFTITIRDGATEVKP